MCRQIFNKFLFPHNEITGPVANHMAKRELTNDSPKQPDPSQKKAKLQQV